MKKRLITGIFIAAVFVGVLALALCVHSAFWGGFVIILMLLAAFEMSRALKKESIRPLYALVAAAVVSAAAAFYLLYYLLDKNQTFAMLGFVAAIFVFALIGFIIKSVRKEKGGIETCFVLVYPVTVLLFMLLIGYLPNNRTAAGLMLLFLVTPLTDVFAYLVGSTLKGPKLAPKISPKKTISGALGGLLGGITGGFLIFAATQSTFFSFLGLEPLGTSIDAVHFLMLGFVGSVLTQSGDLIASAVKRKAGVKDYGKLLPGHGGIMDRIDGMMFCAIFIYLYLYFLPVAV